MYSSKNLAPDAAGRSRFGSADLRAKNPRLITVDISGYGETGEYATMKAYDLLVQAESGLAVVTGHPAGPDRAGVSIADVGCGRNSLYGHPGSPDPAAQQQSRHGPKACSMLSRTG
jgi:crotonobetainyl-CoA:carnitine CoA-transferase CaiB-like acyl-CoA transferase